MSAIGLIQNGTRPAIAYDDEARQELRFAVRNGSTWDLEVIDSLGMFVPSVNFEDGRTTVAYTMIAPPDRGLRFAEKIGGKWKVQDIHPYTVGPQLSTTSGPDGRRAIAFEAHLTGMPGVLHGLLFAKETASGWNVSAIDPGESGIGSVSVAQSGGTYAVAYATLDANYTTHAKLALGDGLTWRIQQIATDVQVGYTSIFASYDSLGALHLLFVRLGNDTLVHRYQQGPAWTEEVVDNGTRPGDIGVHMSATTGPDGEPRLVYLVGDVYRLMYAARGKSGWAYSEIDRNTNRGFLPSLAVDPSDRPHVTFIDEGFPSTTEDLWYATASPESANRPPEPRISVSGSGREGAPMRFDASNSSDPNGDPLQFRWDFNADGIWDTNWSSDPTATHTYGDDLSGTARVEAGDGTQTATADSSVVVRNVAPTLTSVTIALAPGCGGDEHGNHDGDYEHQDGCGDEQGNHHREHEHQDEGCRDGGDADHEGHDGARDDDEDEGACVLMQFNATGTDPGSDDLTFTWDFGDGTNTSRTYFNDGVGPDAYPSPGGTFPVTVTNTTKHTYTTEGNFTVTLTVTDDDGGNTTVVFHVLVCLGDDEHEDHDHPDGCGDHDDEHDGCGDHDVGCDDHPNGCENEGEHDHGDDGCGDDNHEEGERDHCCEHDGHSRRHP